MKRRITLLCLALIPVFSSAQTEQASLPVPATLEQCVQYAVENNISINRSAVTLESSRVDRRDAWGAFLPSLSASGGYSNSQGFSFDSNTNERTTATQQNMSVSTSLSLNLFNGMKDINNYRRAQLALAAEKYSSQAILNDVKLNVVNAYLAILAAEEYEKVAQSQYELSQMQVERMKRMISVGKKAEGDLYEIEAALARDMKGLVDAKNQTTLAYLTLRQLLALDMEVPLKVVTEGYDAVRYASVLEYSPSQIYMSAQQGLPEINKAKKDVEIAQRNIAIAKGQFSPSLTASYSWNNSFIFDYHNPATGEVISIADQWKNNSRQYIQVGLSIPIFNRMTNITNLQRSRLNMRLSQYALSEAQLSLQQKVEKAYADASSSYQSYLAAQKASQASAEALRYATVKFEQDKLNAYDYEMSKNQLLSSQTDALRAKYDYIFKTFLLEYYRTQQIKI